MEATKENNMKEKQETEKNIPIKLCPLRFSPDGDGNCLKENCAWYNTYYGICAVRVVK